MRKSLWYILFITLILACTTPVYAYSGIKSINGVEWNVPYTAYDKYFKTGKFYAKSNTIDFVDERFRYKGEVFHNVNVGTILYTFDNTTQFLQQVSFQIYFDKGITLPLFEYSRDTNDILTSYPYSYLNSFIQNMCTYFNKYYGKYHKEVFYSEHGKNVYYSWECTNSSVLLSNNTIVLPKATLYQVDVTIYGK